LRLELGHSASEPSSHTTNIDRRISKLRRNKEEAGTSQAHPSIRLDDEALQSLASVNGLEPLGGAVPAV
jgi:hypothetical protein